MTIQKLINIETGKEVSRYNDTVENKPVFGGVQSRVEGLEGLKDEPLFRWIPAPQAELDRQAIEDANAIELAILSRLDRESIRDIREWIAAQPSAPQSLKDREAQAVAARGRIQ